MARMIALTEGANTVYVNADLIRVIRPAGTNSVIQFDKEHTIGVKEPHKEVVAIIDKLR